MILRLSLHADEDGNEEEALEAGFSAEAASNLRYALNEVEFLLDVAPDGTTYRIIEVSDDTSKQRIQTRF